MASYTFQLSIGALIDLLNIFTLKSQLQHQMFSTNYYHTTTPVRQAVFAGDFNFCHVFRFYDNFRKCESIVDFNQKIMYFIQNVLFNFKIVTCHVHQGKCNILFYKQNLLENFRFIFYPAIAKKITLSTLSCKNLFATF